MGGGKGICEEFAGSADYNRRIVSRNQVHFSREHPVKPSHLSWIPGAAACIALMLAAVPAGALENMVSWVLSLGPDAEALATPELREGVVVRLEAAVGSL